MMPITRKLPNCFVTLDIKALPKTFAPDARQS
jgi:hypothetical protein